MPVSGAIDDEGAVGGLSDPRTQVGPLARAVADVAVALRVIAGPDGRDGGMVPLATGDPAAVDLRGLRVAIWCEQATDATVAALADSARRCARRARASPARRPAGRPRDHARRLALVRR